MAASIFGLKWLASGLTYPTVTKLDQLVSGDNATTSGASSATGDVVGTANNGSFAKAAQWPSGTAISALDDVFPSGLSIAAGIAKGGSVIFGSSGAASIGAAWTSSGITGHLLTPGTSYTDATPNAISHDGRFIAGSSSTGTPESKKATLWDSLFPILLIDPPPIDFVPFATTQALDVDQSGFPRLVGTASSPLPFVVPLAVFWTGAGAVFRLTPVNPSISSNGTAGFIIDDGTVIFGTNGIPSTPVYWDNLSHSGTLPAGLFYGDVHVMAQLPGGSGAVITNRARALVSGSPVAVGSGFDVDGNQIAIRWVGTIATALDQLAGGTTGVATGITDDATITVGFAEDIDNVEWPVYWTADGSIHKLPTIADSGDVFQGRAKGITPDGAIIWGDGDGPSAPSTISINMDNVVVTSLATESPCTAIQFDPSFAAIGPSLGLRWSDTRGKTFGPPVPQQFSTSRFSQPQWNRTGYARDRVFELFWSSAFKTALNGAFVEVVPWKS